jgi:GH25 family lysozyme M1 (1,4-beta-N-acetylmuramidase)
MMEVPAAIPFPLPSRPFRRARRLLPAWLALAVMGTVVAGTGGPARATPGQDLPGIDLSHHNGTIDWQAVKDSGIKFAFVKATEGVSYSFTQYYFDNRAAAARAHVAFGAYHFARPSGSTAAQIASDGKAEADYFIDTAAPKPGDLLPVLDLENSGGLSISELQDWTWAFLNEVVARIHEQPIIYSGNYFWATYMGDTPEYAEAGFKLLWVPHWTSASSPRVPGVNWGGEGWTFWQYTSCGTVPGVSGCVDRDRFNGTDLTRVRVGTPPSNAQLPAVKGTPEETAVLTASNGEWDGTAPFSFAYRWRRCDSGGGSCAYIPEATGQSYTLAAADVGALVSVEVTASNRLGGTVAESSRTPPVAPYDITPPSVPVFIAPAARYVTTTAVPVGWSSTDDKSGVAAYAVRSRTSPASGAFGPFTDLFTATAQTTTTFPVAPGRSSCFIAMATDRWDNESAWSGERCVTVPFDDRAMTASAGWTKLRGPAFFLQTALSATARGASLSRDGLQAHRIRVMAEKCPSCGRIRVLWDGRSIGTFDLVARNTLHRHLLGELVLPSTETGTLEIRVVSARRPVVIDGVAVTRL